jgi:Uncharacterised nucleotidyltransferase
MGRGRPITDDDSLAAVLSLGALAPLQGADEAARAVTKIGTRAAAALLRRHKVVLATMARLDVGDVPEASAAALRTELQAVHEPLVWKLAVLPEVVGRLATIVSELGIRAAGMKGLASRQWYDDPSLRDFGDLDVWVDHERDAWALTERLRGDGYFYDPKELPWFKRDVATGSLYGQMRLRDESGPAAIVIDVHFGAYSVRHCDLLSVRPLEADGWSLLGVEDNFLCAVGNQAGDHFITLKDVNDLLLLLRNPAVDWLHVLSVLRTTGLYSFFNAQLKCVQQLQQLDGETAETVAKLAGPAWSEPRPPLGDEDWWTRWAATTMHAARSPRLNLLDRARATATGVVYYGRPLHLRAGHSWRQTRLRLNNWTCVRLVPLDLAMKVTDVGLPSSDSDSSPQNGCPLGRAAANRSGEAVAPFSALHRHPTHAGDVVAAAGEVFVPTVWYRLDPAVVAAARDLAP